MNTETAYAKFAQLQKLMSELHDAPAGVKAQIAQYLESEAESFQEESEDDDA
jgi:hypothetical protein